jgi:outer membrane protein assembly factor BamA
LNPGGITLKKLLLAACLMVMALNQTLFALEGTPDGSFDNELALSATEERVVDLVLFRGQHRTQPKLIEARIGIKPGDSITRADAENAAQRLRNTDLFNDIRWGLFSTADGVTLMFFLREKWAVLPALQIDTIGTDVAFQGGAVDFNSFGIGMMNLVTYGWYDGYSSLLWIAILPRLEEVPLSFLSTLKIDKENVYFVDEDGDKTEGYTLTQWAQKIKMEYWFNDNWSLGPYLTMQADTVNSEYLESSVPLSDNYAAFSFSPGVAGYYRNSRIVDYRTEGFLAEVTLQPGFTFGEREDVFVTAEFQTYFSKLFANWFQVRGRLQGGFTTSDNVSLWFTGGGFMEIRGIDDGFLNGPLMYLFNVETAFTLFQRKAIALEAVLFFDIGATPSGFDDLDRKPSMKYGAGIHVPLPVVSAFQFRFDLAWGPESPEPVFVFSVMPLFRPF